MILLLGLTLLFCSSREGCFHFVNNGGMEEIVWLLSQENSPAITLMLLGIVECATRHGIGCEGFLGWWPRGDENVPVGNSDGYSFLLSLLLGKQRHDVAALAAYILHRLRFYEIATRYEVSVQLFVADLCYLYTFKELFPFSCGFRLQCYLPWLICLIILRSLLMELNHLSLPVLISSKLWLVYARVAPLLYHYMHCCIACY